MPKSRGIQDGAKEKARKGRSRNKEESESESESNSSSSNGESKITTAKQTQTTTTVPRRRRRTLKLGRIRQHLPMEIYLHILSFLPTSSLYQLALVNKAFAYDASNELFARGAHFCFPSRGYPDQEDHKKRIARLQWFISPENAHRAAQLRILSFKGYYSYTFKKDLATFLEPSLEVVAQESDTDTDDGNDAPAAEIPPLIIVHRRNVIFEHLRDVEHLIFDFEEDNGSAHPALVWPEQLNAFSKLKVLVWNTCAWPGDANSLIHTIRRFARHQIVPIRMHLTYDVNSSKDTEDVLWYTEFLVEGLSPGGPVLELFQDVPLITLHVFSRLRHEHFNKDLSIILSGSEDSIENLSIVMDHKDAETLPARHFSRLRNLAFKSTFPLRTFEGDPQDPFDETINYHTAFARFFELNNNLTSLSLTMPPEAFQAYIDTGLNILTASGFSTQHLSITTPQSAFLPNLKHLKVENFTTGYGIDLTELSQLLSLHGHGLLSIIAPVDVYQNRTRGWMSEADVMRHMAALPRLEYISLSTTGMTTYRGNARKLSGNNPFISTFGSLPPWQILAQKSKTIKYIVSYSFHERSDISGHGIDAWFVERRTKLPNRREGLNHKDGRKKQIGDILKINNLDAGKACTLIDDYFSKHIGEGYELAAFRKAISRTERYA